MCKPACSHHTNSILRNTTTALHGRQINCEVFGAWLSSGLDPDRLTAKLGRLLGQLTGRCGTGAERKKRRRLKGGVRSLFEKVDQDATGTASRHDMKVK